MGQIEEIQKVEIRIKGNKFAESLIRQFILNDGEIKMMYITYREFEELLETLYETGDIKDYKITQK